MTHLLRSSKAVAILFISTLCLFSSGLVFAKGKLVDYSYIGEFTKEQAKAALQKIPALNNLETKYNVALYKIHYNTKAPDGSTSIASGLVAMPLATGKSVAIVSFQHGTRVTRNDVPSRNDEKNYIYPAAFGSSGGFMVVMPDYLGLGDNTLVVHPYVIADSLALTSIDMLIAAKELAATLVYPVSQKLFLAGYSEGGYSTIVMYEALQNQHPELPITAASPGSAPYDWSETIRFVALDPGPRSTIYLAYFFYSMQTYRHYWSGLNEIFRKPYDTLIPDLLDGYHQLPEIQQALPADPHLIFNEAFLATVIEGRDAHSADLIQNFNHYDFTANSPFLMVGTKGDRDVPYHGAEIAYQTLKAKSDKVQIKAVSEVLDHIQAFPFVLREQLEFFKQYD